jgi:glycerol uptake facilitator-like aquaporin
MHDAPLRRDPRTQQAAPAPPGIAPRVGAEAIGTALLLAAIVGSGIMAERLSGGNIGLALLANAIATAGALYALIAALGPVSGAHFNPAVSLVMAWRGDLAWCDVPAYLAAQVAGGVAGVWAAHLMFELPILQASAKARSGLAQGFSEVVASFGLVLVIWLASRRAPATVPAAVAGYIAGAYWFTASTSFANPAVTIARSLSDTFAGIRPADAPLFIAAQLVGAVAAALLCRWLDRERP